MIYLDLILNLSLLVALSLISSFIENRWSRQSRFGVLLQGALFGGAAVLGMLRPLNLGPGLIFDGRSVLVSLCALFFGPWAAAVAGAMTILCRIGLGGMGTLMGILVILSSAGIGLVANSRLKPETDPLSTWSLYLFGLIVHAVMLTLAFTLPGGAGLPVIMRIGIPVMVLYPLATILSGKILSDQFEAKRVMTALSKSEKNYRELVEQARTIILRLDVSGNITFINEYAQQLFGFTAAEIVGRNVLGTIVPETDSSGRNYVRLVKEICSDADAHVDIENENITKNGQLLWVHWSNRAIRNASGRIVGILSIGSDITGRKRAEAEREELQAQLIQAQKMESVGRLAGGVAHDYNNMLGVILGYTELAMEKVSDDDPLHDNLNEILKAAKRSTGVTRQLLAFARKQTIMPKILDINETVEGMLKMLRRLIGEDIDLAWHPRANLWPLKMDPTQLDQILANLCVNARDAIAGVGKVTIETDKAVFDAAYCRDHEDSIPGEYVLLAVSDDGDGMDKETLDNLFEPFFTTKGIGQGTGLGLSTVYGIVKQNEGFINVYSEPGKGSTFRIYLPRHMGVAEEIRTESIAVNPRGCGETILLVEDESSILRLANKMLVGLGYNVLIAGTPGEAMGLAGEYASEIHLLITDVVMPEMNGRDLADRLQATRPDIKTLFMSGYTTDAIFHRGVVDKGVNFIQKPFSTKDLASKVRAIMTAPNGRP